MSNSELLDKNTTAPTQKTAEQSSQMSPEGKKGRWMLSRRRLLVLSALLGAKAIVAGGPPSYAERMHQLRQHFAFPQQLPNADQLVVVPGQAQLHPEQYGYQASADKQPSAYVEHYFQPVTRENLLPIEDVAVKKLINQADFAAIAPSDVPDSQQQPPALVVVFDQHRDTAHAEQGLVTATQKVVRDLISPDRVICVLSRDPSIRPAVVTADRNDSFAKCFSTLRSEWIDQFEAEWFVLNPQLKQAILNRTIYLHFVNYGSSGQLPSVYLAQGM